MNWGRSLGPHPNNWLNPVFGFVWRKTNNRPQLVPALLCKVGAEGIFDFDETVVDEVLDMMGGQADVLGFGHYTFSVRPPRQRSRFDLIGADAPERLGSLRSAGRMWT
jgi:hypothetical protein